LEVPPRSRDHNSINAYGSLREAPADGHVQAGRDQVPAHLLADDDGAGDESERGGVGANLVHKIICSLSNSIAFYVVELGICHLMHFYLCPWLS